MGRRTLLKLGLGTLLLPSQVSAYPITKLLGNPGPIFTKNYIRRFVGWYEKTWAPIVSQMSAEERSLFNLWEKNCTSLGSELLPGLFIENFLVRHHLHGRLKEHGSTYFGLSYWPDDSEKVANQFIHSLVNNKEAKALTSMKFFGWSSNFDSNTKKLFFKTIDPGLLYYGSKQSPLGFVEISKGRLLRKVSIEPVHSLPETAHRGIEPSTILSGFKLTDNKGNTSWKLRTRSTYLLPLKTGTMTVAGSHKKEFHQMPDFIDVSKNDEIKIYYP